MSFSSSSSSSAAAATAAPVVTKTTRATMTSLLNDENDVANALAVLDYIAACGIQSSAGYAPVVSDDVFELRFKNIMHFADYEHAALLALSTCVLSASVSVERRRLTVRVRRTRAQPNAARRQLYAPPTTTFERVTPLDYEAMGLHNADDRAHVDAVVDAVYNIHEVMPHVGTWVELLRLPATPSAASRAPPPTTTSAVTAAAAAAAAAASLRALTAPSGDDESETGAADDASVIGYALCFHTLPDIDGAFFEYLLKRYDTFVTRACLWFDDKSEATLVVNVRRSTTDRRLESVQALHRSRGNPLSGARKRTRLT